MALDSPAVLSELPGELHRRFAVGEAEVAWVLNPQGTVWRVGLESGDVVFVKVLAASQYPSLADERDRLLWAADRLPVPQVLDYGADGSFEWLALSVLAGRDATQPEHLDDPATTVPILAHGLRRFHDTAVAGCPFDFRLDVALDHARRRVNGDGVPASTGDDLHEEHAHLTPRAALELLDATRPVSEDVVLCHGDYCFPNLLIEQAGSPGTSTWERWVSLTDGGISPSPRGVVTGTSDRAGNTCSSARTESNATTTRSPSIASSTTSPPGPDPPMDRGRRGMRISTERPPRPGRPNERTE